MSLSAKKLLAALSILSTAVIAVAQDAPATTPPAAPARPAVAFPPTPTPAPKEEPMTEVQLDQFLIPSQYLARTSDVLCIVYNGFRRSQIDPCGCVTHQLGGLDKEARLVKRIEEHKIPAIQVDAGGFMRDLPEEKLIVQSKALLKGLGEIGYDAINVGFTDLALAPDELKKLAADAGLHVISANITDQSGALVFEPYTIKEVTLTDGTQLKVGVVGVTRPRVEMSGQPLDAPTSVTAGGNVALQITDPAAAINKYAAELSGKADFVVALVYDRRSNADKFVNALSDKKLVDVLITGENTQIQGSVQAIGGVQVVSGGYEGRQVGTLYVELKDKEIASTWNRHIEVLQTIPPVAEITKLIEETHRATEQPTGAPVPEDGPMKLKL
jgi:2',3'-cyclic-nucleotide 2'-phosphodiesterase (5'-nucleotidase family)